MGDHVTVLGAGLTGLTLGLLCARSGRRVTVVDPELHGEENQGVMAAPVTVQQELQYHHIERWDGAPAALAYAEQVRRGQEFVLAMAADLGIAVHYADMATVTADGREAFWLRYEVRAMRAVGFDPDFTDSTGLPFTTRPQLVSAAQPVIDVPAYRAALLDAYAAAGGELTAERPADASQGWVVSTTGEPAFGGPGISLRLRPATWNWIEFTAEDPAVLPTRSSFDLDDGGRVLAVAGERAWLGSRATPGLDWVTRHIEGARILSQWQARTNVTFDAMPFVGHAGSRSGRRLVACGFDCWELTLGAAAALQLFGRIEGSDAALPWQPARFPRTASVGRALWGKVRHGLRIHPVTPFPRRR